MNIDPNTGLPQLPEGQYWKVEIDEVFEEPFVILMRRRKWWTSAQVHSVPVLSGWDDPNEKYLDRVRDTASPEFNDENIRRSAQRLLDILEMQENEREARQKNSRLLGDYPPNKVDTPITIQEGQ